MEAENTVRASVPEQTATPAEAPEVGSHLSTVERSVVGELVVPADKMQDENRSNALVMLRRVLGRESAHFDNVAGLRQGFALVWNNLGTAEHSLAQQRIAALVEMFQQNDQASVLQALSKKGVTVGTTDYVRLSELNSIYKAYLLMGTSALESATYDEKGNPQPWHETRKAITAVIREGEKAIKASRIAFESAEKVKLAMKIPRGQPLSPEASKKAEQMAAETIAAQERQAQLVKDARKTPQGKAQAIAQGIIRDCKFKDEKGIERIDEAKCREISSKIEQALTDELQAIATKAVEAEKKQAEATKH